MPSIAQTTDNAPTKREVLFTAGMEMACSSVSRAYVDSLDHGERDELERVWVEFMANLAGLGVDVPTNPKGL